jgi:hypothetical protein
MLDSDRAEVGADDLNLVEGRSRRSGDDRVEFDPVEVGRPALDDRSSLGVLPARTTPDRTLLPLGIARRGTTGAWGRVGLLRSIEHRVDRSDRSPS